MTKYLLTRRGKQKLSSVGAKLFAVAYPIVPLSLKTEAKYKILKFLNRYKNTGRTREQIIGAVSWGRNVKFGDELVTRALHDLVRDNDVRRG